MRKRLIRNISASLAALLVLSSFSCFSGFAEETDNGYDYTISDATLVQRYCAFMEELSESQKDLYDVNFDGFISVGDASLIQQHAAGAIDINSDEYQSKRPEKTTEPVTEEIITEEITTEEATTEKIVTEEPVEEITTEEVTEEPTTEQPAEEVTTEEATQEVTEEETDADDFATYVRFGQTTLYMGINETYFLELYTDALEIKMTSSDESVAYITDDMEIIPLKIGMTVITCETPNGLSAECTVYVGAEADALIMNTPAITVGVTESFDLNSFTVGNGKFAANRWFYSSNEDVAVVDIDTGEFAAVGVGKAVITCELINGVTAECEVTVLPLSETVTLNTYNVTGGVGETLGFNSYPESGKAVFYRSYYSEDESIVEIDKKTGLMHGVAVGSTRIYCELENGFRVYADVKIMAAPATLTLSSAPAKMKVGDTVTLHLAVNSGAFTTPYTLTWTSSFRSLNIEKTSGYSVTLKAKCVGTSTITAKTYNGKTVSCKINVNGTNVKCIDISSWQGSNVDFNKIKASGIDYVVIRAGFRNTADNQFVYYYNKAKAAGLKIGSYWYMNATNVAESQKEAETCIKTLGGRKLDLPIYYDIEEPLTLQYASQALLTNMAITFCDALKANGYKVGTYASGSVYSKNYKLNYDLLKQKGYSIWNAEWASSNTIICDVWQYSDSGSVSGISGNVDMDLIYNLYVLD